MAAKKQAVKKTTKKKVEIPKKMRSKFSWVTSVEGGLTFEKISD